jgi:TonB family protein
MDVYRLPFALLAAVIACSCGGPLTAQSNGRQAPLTTNVASEPINVSPEEASRHLVVKIEPVYPPLAKLAHVQGPVRVEVLVNPDGTVVQTIQLSGQPLLAKAADAAIHKYKYEPFEKDGKAVSATFWVQVDFSLPVHKPHSVPFPEVKNYEAVLIKMDTGDFAFKISGDGSVEYKGSDYVVVTGEHHTKLTSAEMQSLLTAFRAADFFSVDDDSSRHAMDAATTTVSIQIGDQVKSVITDVDVPPDIQTLQVAIARISHSDQWVVGNAETVPGLLSEGRDANQTRETLSKALTAAATYSTTAVLADLLQAGADVERTDSEGCTALFLAAERGLPDMVRLLLKAGANARTRDKLDRTPLMFGAASGNADVLAQLMPRSLVNTKSKYGSTALMAAAFAGNPECVRMLIIKRVAVNIRDAQRSTALIAGSTGDWDSLWDGAMAFGLRPEIPDEVVHRDIVVRLLLEAGADMTARNWNGETALFSLDKDAVRELIAHRIDLNMRDKYGQTALIETVDKDIAKILVEAGADLNARDSKGQTALMDAASSNDFEKIRVLTASPKLRIDLRDRTGRTALMIAAADASPDCVKALLDSHPNLNLRDKSGNTALGIAESGLKAAQGGYRYSKSVQLFHEAGAED